MDLFGQNRVSSLGGKSYGLVNVDDYSRYTWVHFLSSKSDTFEVFESFINRIQNKFESKVKLIRTDHGGEFENKIFDELCNTVEFVEKRVDHDQIPSHQLMSIKEKGDDQVIHHDDQSSSEDDAPPNRAIVDLVDELDIPLP